MKLYWWNGVGNLGDLLTLTLFTAMGQDVEWAAPEEAEWVGVGSVLQHAPSWAGKTVWGSGIGNPKEFVPDLSEANVLALRGMLTRDFVGSKVETLGDPGLLVSDYFTPKPQDYTAVVPHYLDWRRTRELYPEHHFVDVRGNPLAAIDVIAGADLIISSSLHGIVLADAFGIPRKWDPAEYTQGGGFKFRDYFSVVGKVEPGEWFHASEHRIEQIRQGLRACLLW